MPAPIKTLKNLIHFGRDTTASLFGSHRYNSSTPSLWILMYHRILPKSDPRYLNEEPGMLVEPTTFRMHLREAKKHFTLITLSEWVERYKKQQSLPKRACVITFDDGWLDNYEHAFPILKEEGVPATLFAVSHLLGTNQQFWPNQIIELLKQPRRKLTALDWLEPHISNIKGDMDRPITDPEVVSYIISQLKRHPDDKLHEWLSNTNNPTFQQNATNGLMGWAELKEMSASGQIDVGSHTCHHYRLREDLSLATMERELKESKAALEEKLERQISVFCYPNGDTCEASVRLASKYYDAAVTTKPGINRINSSIDLMQLNRLGVHQGRHSTNTSFSGRLSGWV